jgi:hypothetical protein
VTSCTKCVRPFRVENPIPSSGSTTHVELVDTPGLDASDLRPDTDILREIAEWLQKEWVEFRKVSLSSFISQGSSVCVCADQVPEWPAFCVCRISKT